MPSDLLFFTHPKTRGRIARWMLEEVGAPYETRILDFSTTMKEASYLALNPMGKVPAIQHGGVVVTECGAICAYLADAFPEAGLAPAPAKRGAYYRWLFFGAGPLDQAFTNTALKIEPPEARKGMLSYGDLERVNRTLAHALAESPYIAGETFTAADVYMGALIDWSLHYKLLEATPRLEAYRDRLAERPAHQRAQALDDEAVAALEAEV